MDKLPRLLRWSRAHAVGTFYCQPSSWKSIQAQMSSAHNLRTMETVQAEWNLREQRANLLTQNPLDSNSRARAILRYVLSDVIYWIMGDLSEQEQRAARTEGAKCLSRWPCGWYRRRRVVIPENTDRPGLKWGFHFVAGRRWRRCTDF